MLLFLVSWLSLCAHAYIPEWSMISSRAAEQHGRSAYKIEQEVIYRHEAEQYSVKESWLVAGESSLSVSLEGRGPLKGLVEGSIIFTGSMKSYIDGGQVKNQRLGDEWLEPLFHFRTGKYLRSRMVQLRVTPPDSLHDRPPMNSEGLPMYEPPSFIRLSRAGGSVSWAIGMLPLNDDSPTLWLEQDQFVLRKYKSANQVLLRADEYVKFEDGLWFPRSRTYEFGGFKIEVKTLSVKNAGKITANDKRLKSSGLSPSKDNLRLPDLTGLREFYLRFR